MLQNFTPSFKKYYRLKPPKALFTSSDTHLYLLAWGKWETEVSC